MPNDQLNIKSKGQTPLIFIYNCFYRSHALRWNAAPHAPASSYPILHVSLLNAGVLPDGLERGNYTAALTTQICLGLGAGRTP